MTWFVERRGGAVVSTYRVRRPGIADEALADDDPEIAAYFAPRPIGDAEAGAALDRDAALRALAAECFGALKEIGHPMTAAQWRARLLARIRS